MNKVAGKILEMIIDIQPYVEIDENTSLLDEDILDSVSILLLVQELEEEFDIKIEMDEVNGENFANVCRIAEFVMKKK